MVKLRKLLTLVIDKNASDLYFTVGDPPTIRLEGELRPLNLPLLGSDDIVRLMEELTSKQIQEKVKAGGSGQCDYPFEGNTQFSISVYRYKREVTLQLHLVSPRFPNEHGGHSFTRS